MDAIEEIAEELRAKLKQELETRAEKRDWKLPTRWADDVLDAVQAVFDRERIEVARRLLPGVANPAVTFRLTRN